MRFYKKLNYYKPFAFSLSNEIEFQKEQVFILDEEIKSFNFPYEKKSQINEMLLLNYKLDNQTPIRVKIISPNDNKETFSINNMEGFINFLCDGNGDYTIDFEKIQNINLKSTNSSPKIIIKILSTEYSFNLDITKNNIVFNEFNITGEESPSLKINIEHLEKDYTKKFAIKNIDFNEISKIVKINKNNQGYKTFNNSYYTFEKDINYNITINFNKKGENRYTFEEIEINDYSLDNIKELSLGKITYNDIEDKFLILNWTNYKNISINLIKKKAKFLLSELTENQLKNIVKEFQNLNFKRLDILNINKSIDSDYSILFIELDEEGIEIEFKIIEEKNDGGKEEDKKGLSTSYIVLITLFGIIFIVIILFIIIRYWKKKNTIDFEKIPESINNEKLMSDI